MRFNTIVPVLVAVLLLSGIFGAESKASTSVTLFEEEKYRNLEGGSIQLIVRRGECANFPKEWFDRVSSINSGYACIEFFRYEDCTSRSYDNTIKIGPDFETGFQLGLYDNDLRSAKLC